MAEDAHKYWMRRDAAARGNASGFRAPGANLVAPSSPVAPDATRGEGTLTKYRPVGGWQTPEAPGANLVQGRLEAGEPMTAFRGGAGAPTPTGVIRGMHQTFATDTGGPQPQEFATPQEAGQASNRFLRGQNMVAADKLPPEAQVGAREAIDQKFGVPMVPGQTLAETPAREIPGHAEAWKAQAGLYEEQQKGLKATTDKAQSQQHVTDFHGWLTQSPYATFKDGKLEYKSKDEHMERDRIAAESIAKTQGVDAAKQHFEDRQAIRRWLVTQPLQSGFDANVYINELSANPQLWQQLVTQARQLPPATAKQPWYRIGAPVGAAETPAPGAGFVAP